MSNKRGIPFILSAPSGTGKTTLVRQIMENFPRVVQSISYTTREPRPGETPGKDYHFVSLPIFEEMAKKGEFLNHNRLFGNFYGTSSDWVESQLKSGKHVFLVIDTQGGLELKSRGFKGVYIFLKPPSNEELRRRLTGRHTETSSALQERLEKMESELEEGKLYDYTITNDSIDVAYEVLKSIIIAEEHKNSALSNN
jgi:guanylate kinase